MFYLFVGQRDRTGLRWSGSLCGRATLELQKSNVKVIDLTLKYEYNSLEAFALAFKNMRGITPMVAN
jgi:hypothetical protein